MALLKQDACVAVCKQNNVVKMKKASNRKITSFFLFPYLKREVKHL